MTIAVTCRNCGTVLQAKPSGSGRRGRCTECGHVIRIPGLKVGAVDDVRDPKHHKPCPECGELNVKGATQCVMCGEFFTRSAETWNRDEAREYFHDAGIPVLECVFSLVLPCLAAVIGLIYLIQGKPKGGKIIGVSLFATIFWGGVIASVLFVRNNW